MSTKESTSRLNFTNSYFLNQMEEILVPSTIKLEKEEGNKAIFIIEPCFPGYGHTLGNALRRVLLSSLPGAAVTSVKLKGAGHEFETIEHVKEDVVEIILNLKNLRLKMHTDEPVVIKIDVHGEGVVTAKDIKSDSQVEIANKDLHIATTTHKDAHFEAEIVVQTGMGYVPVEQKDGKNLDIGVILVDSIYTPIQIVSYEVANMRVGQRTDFDQLRISIDTDGTISPREALTRAGEILVKQFAVFTDAENAKKEEDLVEAPEPEPAKEEDETLSKIVQELNLSTRTSNALDKAKIRIVGDLVSRSESELLALEGFGETALKEIKSSLKKLDLDLKG